MASHIFYQIVHGKRKKFPKPHRPTSSFHLNPPLSPIPLRILPLTSPKSGAVQYPAVDSKTAPADSSLISSDASVIDDPGTKSREKRIKLYLDLKGNEKNMDGAEPTRSILDRVEQRRVDYSAVGGVGEEEKEESTVTTANEDRVGDSIDSAGELNESTNLLEFVAGPVAFVPVQSCGTAACDVDCKENFGDVKSLKTRAIPPNHKLQVSVLLTLPESEYNRNLGVFQIRADFLSADGKTLASKSHPSILKFKSEPIRILLTFLKAAPLLAGYISESQTLALKIKGFTERDMPTSCVKVIIEQRAEYGPGAGIPEIYDASIVLESELPLLKRIIWCWKKTIFIWTGMVLFMMELLFALICCWSVIFPRARLRDDPAINNSTPNNVPAQS
ncbi:BERNARDINELLI-SEIP CONGENITAL LIPODYSTROPHY 2-like protein BSCL2 PROTEIN [Salix purpurea]|uniref:BERNARDINELLI-SEIP CONGENITAL LIPODYSTROPHY 2-like protein BSCL2 PROTEIN n=1 Tax=Salix purpurea TaxID=77065 RepID=A0A9Q0WML7_SALPP|nr:BERNARDINELLI-SEIP CONGENITAL LIPODYSTROPHY 2-like protein BSCL2 PROTEIN [Salix purpurea]